MILTCMILVPVIPFILILVIGFYHFKISLETSTVRNLKRIARDQREIMDSFLKERMADLEFIHASYPFDKLRQPEVLNAVFARLQLASNAYTDLGVSTRPGPRGLSRTYPLTGKIYREESSFKEVLRQGVYISDVFLGFRKTPHFVVAMARDHAQGRWVLRATIDSQTFNTLVTAFKWAVPVKPISSTWTGTQTTRRSGGSPLENPADSVDAGDTIRLGYSSHGIDVLANTYFSQKDFLYAAAPLKGGTWVLFVRQAKADAYEALRTTIYMTALICLLGGGLIVMVAFYLTNRIVSRMRQIDAEKAQLGQQLISASRLAELGEMAAGFAHEINNPLQIIKSEHALIEAMMSDLKEAGSLAPSPELTELEDSMTQVSLQISRCAQITQAILKFGRQSEPAVKSIDLRAYIPEVIQMIANRASVNGITVLQEVGRKPPQ